MTQNYLALAGLAAAVYFLFKKQNSGLQSYLNNVLNAAEAPRQGSLQHKDLGDTPDAAPGANVPMQEKPLPEKSSGPQGVYSQMDGY